MSRQLTLQKAREPSLTHPPLVRAKRTIRAVDMFCGGGGTSTGLAFAVQAMREALGQDIELDLTAINHWEMAIESHKVNHPWAKHLQENVENIDPWKVVPSGYLDLLVASPPCVHFSTARGGKPVNDQLRSSAWHILWWIQRLQDMPRLPGQEGERRGIGAILIENVPEFRNWGPLDEDGRPIKSQKGRTFRDFIRALRGMGYNVQFRVLNAADYGDPTSRKRLFIMARKGRRPIRWPRQTHSKDGCVPGTARWRSARSIIDWTRRGKTVFGRRKPLSINTRRRIARGLRERCGPAFEPLARAVEENTGPVPLRAILEAGEADLRAFIQKAREEEAAGEPGEPGAFTLGQQSGGAPRPVSDSLQTIATGGAISLVTLVEFLIGAGGAARQGEPRGVDGPLPVVLTNSRLAVAEAVVEALVLPPQGVQARGGEANKARSIDETLQTILASRGGGRLIETVLGILVPQFGEAEGQLPRYHSLDDPLPAATSHGAGALARVVSFLTSYFGNGSTEDLEEPLGTQTTRDRRALVEAILDGCFLDVHLRMLEVHELAEGMSFPKGYKFLGTRQEQVKQVGNAVAVRVAQALCMTLLTDEEASVLDVEESPTTPPRLPRAPARRPEGAVRQPAQTHLPNASA